MTTLHEQARAEAEKRWPTPDHRASQEEYDSAIASQGAFEDGAEWAATRTREVTTVAELDALRVGSVVRCDDAEGIGMNVAEKQVSGWVYVGSGLEFPSGVLASDKVPFRVLYEPEEGR